MNGPGRCARGSRWQSLVAAAAVGLLWCAARADAAPANWVRVDEGLTLTSSSGYAPELFTFDQAVYVATETGTYVRPGNIPCFGWQKVAIPDSKPRFRNVGDYLYVMGDSTAIWRSPTGGYPTVPLWTKVTSTGVPAGAIIRPVAVFKSQLYAWVRNGDTFDIYRTPDIGAASMAWTKVVSAGFGDPLNHDLGILIEYSGALIAVTTNTRTDPIQSFGNQSYYGTGIEVWQSTTGDLGSWSQVNQDGFGTQATIPGNPPVTVRTNQDFGSAAVYNGYLYVGTLSHFSSAEVWRYNGTGLSGWTNVSPDGLCAGMLGCGGPSRASSMIVYNNLLYLGEGVSTANLETYDGTTWTVVVASETSDPINGHPFEAANRGISSLAILPSPPGGSGDKLFVLTTTVTSGAQIWGYSYPAAPLQCSWRTGEVDLGNEWRYLNWFGYYNMTFAPWVFHYQHGFLFPFNDQTGVFFWENSQQAFWWTNYVVYPFLYRFGNNATWLWYQINSSNPRLFYNWTTLTWESIP